MKALIVADLHYSLRQYDWLLRVADGYDLVILAGDLLDIAGHADLDTQIVVVTKYLARLSAMTRLVVCSGNHDADERSVTDESVVGWLKDVRTDGGHIDGEHIELPLAKITICPWWDGPVVRAQLEAFLATATRPAAGPWIWIHHVPPNHSAVSWTGRDHAGDDLLNELIARHRPDLVVSGHVHDGPFRRGGSWVDRVGTAYVLNPGRQLGELPAFIELDLAAMTLSWVSLAGSAELRILPADQ
jgi:Icc-related predicted phosphoesterase